MICVPICFGIDVKDDFPIFFGSFYKFSHFCIKNKWPIIAQEEYFVKAEEYAKKYPINLSSISEINEIPNIKNINIDSIDKYIITDNETKKVLGSYKNKDDAWISLMNKSDDILFEIIDKQLSLIIKKYKNITALIVWRHNETIKKIAEKYSIKVIEMELSGIRIPSYNFGLCYYQFSNKYSVEELNERYEKFIVEIKNKKIPLLSREELIKLLVSKKEIDNMSKIEEYDFGIALGLRNDYDTKATNSMLNEEIMKKLLKMEKGSNILIRKHPANYNYKYKLENEFALDNSVSSIQFLSKCKRIVSSVSNIGLEAMLFGKTSYTLGKMPFKRFSIDSLDYCDDYVISTIDLNFLIFCYFVPYDIALDNKYISFRNNTNSEYEIYMYHYNYITKMHKKNNMIKLESTRERFLKYIEQEKKLVNENENLKNNNNKLETENNRLKEKLNSIYCSRSWKITKPLRWLKKNK